MDDMSDLNCAITIPPVEKLQGDQLTVGRKFQINCPGSFGNFKTDQARLEIEENLKYSLKLLAVRKMETSPEQLQLEVTSYVPGQYQFNELKLTDGLQTFNLKNVTFKFDSVIEQKEGQEPPKPNGFRILELNWPLSYTLFMAACILLVCVIFIRAFYKKIRLKNLIDDLKNYEVPLRPEAQYYRAIRQIEKNNYSSVDLDNAVKVYLSRKLQIPFVTLRLSESLALFKKKYPLLKKQRKDLKLLLSDLADLREKNQNASLSLIQKTNAYIDALEDLPASELKRGNA